MENSLDFSSGQSSCGLLTKWLMVKLSHQKSGDRWGSGIK